MPNTRARSLGSLLGAAASRVVQGSEKGAGYGPTLARLAASSGHSSVVHASGGPGASVSGGAHAAGVGNATVDLVHDDAGGYSPWSILDSLHALAPPRLSTFDLAVTVSVMITAIPDHEGGSPVFKLIVPWGSGDHDLDSSYSAPVPVAAAIGAIARASFAGTVTRGPDAEPWWHRLTVEMSGINTEPLSDDPTGPTVDLLTDWEATAKFTYIDRSAIP